MNAKTPMFWGVPHPYFFWTPSPCHSGTPILEATLKTTLAYDASPFCTESSTNSVLTFRVGQLVTISNPDGCHAHLRDLPATILLPLPVGGPLYKCEVMNMETGKASIEYCYTRELSQ